MDEHKELMPRPNDIPKQPPFVKLMLVATVLTVLVTAVFILGKTLPFEPLRLDYFEVSPEHACGGDEVEVYLTGEIKSGPYTLDSAEGITFWYQDEEDKRPYGAAYVYTDDVNPVEKTTGPSPSRRVAPFTEGTWYSGVDVEIRGSMFGFIPRAQHLQIPDEHSYHEENNNVPLIVDGRRSDGCDV